MWMHALLVDVVNVVVIVVVVLVVIAAAAAAAAAVMLTLTLPVTFPPMTLLTWKKQNWN
jgi:hypothetical protein